MQSRKDKNGYWLILDKGEEVKSAISAWAKKEGIKGASISGIGGLTNVELAAYHPEKGMWTKRKFQDNYELLSLNGNINEDGLHAHVVMCYLDFKVIGGHLESAVISTFGEFFAIVTDFVGKTELEGTLLKKIDLNKKG